MERSELDKLKVLVVDDSAVVRQVMTAVLSSAGAIEVTVAQDPVFALQKIQKNRPDVVLLDLRMPRMDGMTFLEKMMKEDPLPIVICSEAAPAGTALAIDALRAGAVDIITKPRIEGGKVSEDWRLQALEIIRGAASTRRLRRGPSAQPNPAGSRPLALGPRRLESCVVAFGASTGGTDALHHILSSMPVDCPPLLVTQHMPEGFTAAFAQHLNQRCAIEVIEAQGGEELRAGRALIAPGNRHLELAVQNGSYRAQLSDGPPVCRHRPSVDVLFESVARHAGRRGIGVILTGMGADGAQGLLSMKRAGAATFAQDEDSCVVYGMPREAVELGAVEHVITLEHMPYAVLNAVGRLDARVS